MLECLRRVSCARMFFAMRDSAGLRLEHIRQFSRLSAEVQLTWALETGYFLRGLMSQKDRLWADRLRNGGKKIRQRSLRPS